MVLMSLKYETPESFLFPLIHTKEKTCEHTMRRQPSASQMRALTRTWPCWRLITNSWPNFCYLSYPADGILYSSPSQLIQVNSIIILFFTWEDWGMRGKYLSQDSTLVTEELGFKSRQAQSREPLLFTTVIYCQLVVYVYLQPLLHFPNHLPN